MEDLSQNNPGHSGHHGITGVQPRHRESVRYQSGHSSHHEPIGVTVSLSGISQETPGYPGYAGAQDTPKPCEAVGSSAL